MRDSWGPRQSGCALFSDRCGTTKDRALLLVSPGESFSANCKARIFWAFSARLKSRPVTCCISQSIFHSLSKKRALQGDSNCQRANSIAAWAGVRPLIFKGLGRVPSLHHPTNQHPVCHGRGYARGFCQQSPTITPAIQSRDCRGPRQTPANRLKLTWGWAKDKRKFKT
jgi:hypothetical protein